MKGKGKKTRGKSKRKSQKDTSRAGIKSWLAGAKNDLPVSSRDKQLRRVFYMCYGFMLLIMILVAVNTGINEDEKFHVPYSNILFHFPAPCLKNLS
jgi:hypothetical protein